MTLGKMTVWIDGSAVIKIGLNQACNCRDVDPLLDKVFEQINWYLAGKLTAFDLPLAPVGTEFQQQVWQALLQIPYGQTRTYAQIAAQIGRPKAVRAVGTAIGKNPIPIIVPCHRVVAKAGLGGFSLGLPIKKRLLAIEQAPKTDR